MFSSIGGGNQGKVILSDFSFQLSQNLCAVWFKTLNKAKGLAMHEGYEPSKGSQIILFQFADDLFSS